MERRAVDGLAAPRLVARIGHTVSQIGPVRVASTIFFLVLALLFARHAWSIPLAIDAERGLYDWRLYETAPRVDQDERITLLVYTDETLEALAKRSPLDRRMLAEALRRIDTMGARAIGVDILIDQPQQEDALLLDALRDLKTPTYLAFASNRANPDYIKVWQEEYLLGFLRRAAPGPVQPGSIILQPDRDNVIRSWPARSGLGPPPLSYAMAPLHTAFANHSGSIVFRLPRNQEYPVFSKLPIELFTSDMAPAMRRQIEGRFVLIGGDIQDLDDYETPMTRVTGELTKGLEIHAHLLAQMLDGRLPNPVPGWALWIAAAGVVTAGALTSLLDARGWRLAVVLVAQGGFFGLLPFYLQSANIDTLGLPAFGWGAGWALAFATIGTAARAVGSKQRQFAQSALGKYLPADIAAQILRDPARLTLNGEKREIYAMFTDLEGFTKLSHSITPEQLSTLLNSYLDLLSDIVLRHGGTIDKFVGDSVVSFWGAPIARDDDADRAVQAAMAIFRAGNEFTLQSGEELPPIGRTRVGLHRGEAVVGNFGGEGRMQYTAIGDGMNTASRLESANKMLHTTILVSTQAKQMATHDIFRPMGRIGLSGRATPIEVWEPVPEMDVNLREQLVTLWQRYDGGDRSALEALTAIAAAHKTDAALLDFVYRIGRVGPGGSYELGSK